MPPVGLSARTNPFFCLDSPANTGIFEEYLVLSLSDSHSFQVLQFLVTYFCHRSGHFRPLHSTRQLGPLSDTDCFSNDCNHICIFEECLDLELYSFAISCQVPWFLLTPNTHSESLRLAPPEGSVSDCLSLSAQEVGDWDKDKGRRDLVRLRLDTRRWNPKAKCEPQTGDTKRNLRVKVV